jgi:alanine racemase
MTTTATTSASAVERVTFALVDLDVIRSNVRELRRRAGAAETWCVVKANGYGHGAVPIAKACLEAGATGLCVALTQEALELRDAGISDVPILVLSEQPLRDHPSLVAANVTPTLYSLDGVASFAAAVRAAGSSAAVGVHIKVDTGMHRVGCDPSDLAAIVAAVEASRALRIEAIFTHLARADEPDDPFTAAQLATFDAAVGALGYPNHVVNSGGLLVPDVSNRSIVRAGIALYGLVPGAGVAHLMAGLEPALSLRSAVGFVKRTKPGAGFSYGQRVHLDRAATIATIPVGYADGSPRRLGLHGGEVLIGGKRRPILGVVTMDQLIVDCGDDDVAVGDEVVLIGRQGGENVTADEWAARCDTIAYEIVCGISARVPRRYAGA